MVGFFLALVVLDFNSIKSSIGNRSELHRAVFGIDNGGPAHGLSVRGLCVVNDDGWTWLWLEEIPDEAYANGWPPNVPGARRELTLYCDLSMNFGTYHLTTRRQQVLVWPDTLSDQDIRQLMRAVMDAGDRVSGQLDHHLFLRSLFEQGVLHRETPILLGYVRNCIAASLAGMAILCFTLGRTWLWLPNPKRWAENKRLAAGKCFACGYDLTGLGQEQRVLCPECGECQPRL